MIRKSQATRGHTWVNNLTLISLPRSLMKHAPLTNTQNFAEKSGRRNVSSLIKRDIFRRKRNFIKSVTEMIFVWPLDGYSCILNQFLNVLNIEC